MHTRFCELNRAYICSCAVMMACAPDRGKGLVPVRAVGGGLGWRGGRHKVCIRRLCALHEVEDVNWHSGALPYGDELAVPARQYRDPGRKAHMT